MFCQSRLPPARQECEGEGRELCSASTPLVPSGLLHSMPFLQQPLTLYVTKMENKMGFVFRLWSVNALRLGSSVGKVRMWGKQEGGITE